MRSITPCYRHPRGTWIAACAECTAWHMAGAIARRDGTAYREPPVPGATGLPHRHDRLEGS
jgi:hypothetical protein